MTRSIRAVAITLFFFHALAAQAIPAEGHKLMISGPSPHAVEVGRKVSARGGNVVDVAVAIGLTLSVTSPYFAALGGGGFAIVKMDKHEAQAIDFREAAPQATNSDHFLKLEKNASRTGGHAIATPGFPMGLYELHKKYGKLSWKALFAEPTALAGKGFQVSGEWVENTNGTMDRFNKAGRATFGKKGGAYKPGETIKQPRLLKALTLLRDKGPKGFYEGEVAKDMVTGAQAAGGKLALEDFKNYKVRWLTPMTTEYEGHKLYLMPPPSSGGIIILQALKMIEKLQVKSKPALSTDEFHLLAEIESRAYRSRSMLGDPDFHKNPVAYLTADWYLNELTKTVNIKKAQALKPLSEADTKGKESAQTTHYSVMDANGNAVALTVTLNGDYGSGVVSEKFGIALNNQMDDFTTRPGEPNMYGLIQGPGNEVEPGKRPLSSMSPTLIEKNGKIVASLGAPGGPRIISGVLQAIYRIVGRDMDIDMAIQAPRVHHQFLPNTVYVDRQRLSPEIIDGLRARGHQVEESWMAKVFVVRLRGDGILQGAYDSRGEGWAGGL